MKNTGKLITILLIVFVLMLLTACSKVGSERWCKNMEDKSVADWSARETKDFAKHCVFD